MSAETCASDGCGKPGTMRCPQCVQLGLPGSYFCDQACFAKSWKSHKGLHKLVQDAMTKAATEGYNPWPGYQFSGPLRPFPRTPMREMPASIGRPEYADTGIPYSEKRDNGAIPVYTPEEIAAVRLSSKLGREVLNIAGKAVAPGVTCEEIDRIVHEATIERDSYPSPLNYKNFPKSCCISVNEVICHGIPDSYVLKDGDIVNVDVSVFHRGYHTDLNEMFLVGNVDEEGKRLVKSAHDCLQLAIDHIKPGEKYRELGNVMEKHAKAQGHSVVRLFVGHGVGSMYHCAPNIPHYAKNKAVGVMRPGHIFTVEPMINEGTHDGILWPDDWTWTTRDGKRSAQFEHTLLVTDDGVECLTARTDGSTYLNP